MDEPIRREKPKKLPAAEVLFMFANKPL